MTDTKTDQGKIITVEIEQPVDVLELSRFCGVHPRTVERLIRNGGLPKPCWIGGKRRWYRSEVNSHILAERAKEAEPEVTS